MADTVLKIIVNGEDNASGMLRGLSGLLKGGQVVGAGAAVAGLAGLGAVLKSSVSEAEAAEEVTAQLNAVLESTKGIAGVTAEAINDHALALSELTRFEDDEIASASSLLLTFTKIGSDVFPDATEATLDMATALKMDLRSATMMVGKALNDPIRGITTLTRSGIQFTDQQREMIDAMIEAGDIAGAQRMILAELETQFGGSAEAAGKTAAGMRDILGNALGNVKEEIGGALLPLLKDLTLWAGPKLVSAFRQFGSWVTGGIADIRELAGKLGTAKDIIGDMFRDIEAGRPIRWADMYDLAGLVTTNRDTKVRFAEFVQDVAKFALDVKAAYEQGGIEGAIKEIGSQIAAAWDEIDWEAIKTKLVTHWNETLQPALKTAITSLNEFTKGDPQLFADVGAAIGEAINLGIAQYQETNKKGGQLGVIVAEMMGGSVDGATFWDAFGKSLRQGVVSPTLQNAVSGVMDGILAKVIEANPILQTYIDTAREIVTQIGLADDKFGEFGQALSGGLSNPFQGILDVVNALVDAIQRAIDKFWVLANAGANEPKGPGPFAGVQAGVSASAPAASIPGSGRSANGAGVWNVTLNINAPGGDPAAVSRAAQDGVLRAARSMGLA